MGTHTLLKILCTMALRSLASARLFATASPLSTNHHKVVVVGAGSAGVSVANMLYNRFADEGRQLTNGDIALVDGADYHNYQPGWTLVGSGLAQKEDLRRPLPSLIPSHLHLHSSNAASFSPSSNSLTLASGSKLTYDFLIVCPGLQTNFGAIKGLPEALEMGTKESGVGTIYSYKNCDSVWNAIQDFGGKKAIFTQPKGIIKCAGAPQKIMWMARSQWERDGKVDKIGVEFVSGMPAMFAVPKYAKALSALADDRSVQKTLNHNLVSIDASNRVATFENAEGGEVTKEFDFLHAVPPQGPLEFIKNSPLANADGWVSVDNSSLQHTKYPNIFSLGDASSLPTSKTAAAVTAQTPVVVENLKALMEGKRGRAVYDGYTSCPLLTGHNELMLAEFKYGAQPDETFAKFGFDQAVPNRLFYHLKKDIFPWAYFNWMTQGQWYGKKGLFAPRYDEPETK